ncbi:ABC transporter permease [Alkalibaculum bacchi]|uniref:ABC transporter permease n=1 Tax=Alkalibaculum bacchi TaxID=645887 RepID=UPI0026F257C6|nr:ABC transporter permease [Alkalibaculum bacchi]
MLKLYMTRVKCLIRNKSNVFWTFLFPIVLATLFHLAFSNLNSSEVFHSIPIGVIENNEYENTEIFIETMSSIKTSENQKAPKLFEVSVLEKEKAEEALKEDKIIGYIYPKEDMELTVKESGIEQTIVKSFLDGYSRSVNTVQSLIELNPQNIENILEDIQENNAYLEDYLQGGSSPDTTLNFFYSLIAMACLFGCFWGLTAITDIQANLSLVGARINIAPMKKMKLLFCNISAALTVHFTGILLLMAYLMNVLKINFGDDLNFVVLSSFVSSLLGVSLGAMVSALSNKDLNFKYNIMSAVTMFSCFLSGLMSVQVKYIVATRVPLLQYINPAHIITDAFYSLYYYETKERFFLNIGLMISYSLAFSIITYMSTRRKKYASI